jgi:hypothetical protein
MGNKIIQYDPLNLTPIQNSAIPLCRIVRASRLEFTTTYILSYSLVLSCKVFLLGPVSNPTRKTGDRIKLYYIVQII